MTKTRSRELDFGSREKTVRWIEDTDPAEFRDELARRVQKLRPDAVDSFLFPAAMAAVRSIRHSTNGRVPHGLLTLASARALCANASPEVQQIILRHALTFVNSEIQDPGFGPFRLLHFEEVAGQGKEGTLFSFLEAVRAGDTDWADHRFAWLVRNLERDQIVDSLVASGLEGVTTGSHKIIFVVEVVSLLQGLGWEHAPILLRPVVRHQAAGPSDLRDYDACRDLAGRRELLRLARRRSPGQPALGESEPEAFLQRAILWAESEPEQRTSQIAEALARGDSLEDCGDLLMLGACLLFLQESLRPQTAPLEVEELDRRVHLVTTVFSLRQLVRLGTPGQRILGLLLAGWVPPVRDTRLNSRLPDCSWWLPPMMRLREPLRGAEEAAAPPPEAWRELILGRQANGLLPMLTAELEQGRSVARFEEALAALAPRFDERSPGLAMKLEHTLAEAYRTSKTPYRWACLWAAALGLSLWPRAKETEGLQEEGSAAKIHA